MEAGEKPVRKRRITFLRVLMLSLALLTGYLEYRHRHPEPVYAGRCNSSDPKALSVLFIGNSLTFHNDLPALFCDLALHAGPARVRSVTAPGWSLHNHLDSGDAERALADERWDFVVLQEQGPRPTFDPADFEVSLRQLAAIGAAHGARAAIYETWPMLDNRQDANTLHEEFAAVSRETGFLLVPVGTAWRHAASKHPTLDFLAPDQHHPSLLGSAFAAEVFYASLLNRSPEGLPSVPGVDSEIGRDLQRIAWLTARSRAPAAEAGSTLRSGARATGRSAVAVALPTSTSTSTSTPKPELADAGAESSVASLEGVDLDRLPSVTPARCPQGGAGESRPALPSVRKAILEAIQAGWPEQDDYSPRGCRCIGVVQITCGPDLDGAPGHEVLAEVSYRIPQEGVTESESPLRPPCTSNERVDQTVVVALSPPTADRPGWTLLGIVGFSVRGAGEGGTVIKRKRFVRLPDGTTGIYARAFTPGFTDQDDVILVYSKDDWHWRNAVVRPVSAGAAP